MERWHGKVAVVTGASAGIGLTTAKQLVQHGLIVIGLARRVDQMKEQMKNATGPGQFHAKQCDITNENNVIEVFKWIRNNFKALHILVNNAGSLTINTIEDAPTSDIENTFKINVFGLLYCTKQAIKLMKETQNEAHIINVNSVLGHKIMAIPDVSSNVYSGTKFAVTALTETLKVELSDSKIRVTSISPGAVRTQMFENFTTNFSAFKGAPALESNDVSSAIIYAISAPAHVEINDIILQTKGVFV